MNMDVKPSDFGIDHFLEPEERDWQNTIATEKKISREEERKEIAKEMKADNEPVAKIMKYTKLTEEEINQL